MPATGIYFVPSNPNSPTALASITERLRATYDPVPIGRWGLEHKLMRDTHSCLPASAYAPLPPLQPRFMQFLSLTHHPSHGFIYTSDRPDPDPWAEASQPKPATTAAHHPHKQPTPPSNPPGTGTGTGSQPQPQPQSNFHPPTPLPMTMMTPDPTSFISWLQITLRACEPLWSHRHTVAIPTGVVYEVADFRVRIGDVRQTFPITRIRGTVVEIEYCGPGTYSNDENLVDDFVGGGGGGDGRGGIPTTSPPVAPMSMEDWDIGEVLIREFWERLGISGGREAIRVPDVGKEISQTSGDGRRKLSRQGNRGGEGRNHRAGELAGVDLARQYMEIFRFNR